VSPPFFLDRRMSWSRWALSLFLVCHLSLIGLASLPPEVRQSSTGAPRYSIDDPIASVLTPVVDKSANVVASLTSNSRAIIRRARRLSARYVSATGLGQTWNMFSRPWTENRYARLRYYVAPSQATKGRQARPAWMATEMVFPALQTDDRRHFLRSFRAFPRDKAFFSSMETSLSRSSRTEFPADLAPVVRYFGDRFRRGHLVDGEHIVRTEVWLGASPIRARGLHGDPQAHDARQRALTESYARVVEQVAGPGYPALHAIEMQEDIVWRLEFFEQ
jgi:hypothetical protein